MATTDARSGFRLPWSGEQRSTEDEAGPEPAGPDGDAAAADASPGASARATTRTPGRASGATGAAGNGSGGRRPSKFLADLTRAMQAAAESAREETLTRLQADAKTWVEEIHARSADGATDLRRRADDEVAAIREWSKAEMARIREETELRITDRKQRLETEIDEHGARIERRVEAVQRRVAEFEAEMGAFFERLLAEDDPGRFASLAENLPEPPPFDDIAAEADDESAARAAVDSAEIAQAGATTDDQRASAAAPHQAAPDFAAAEAEALAGVDGEDDADLPELDDAEINARLANLVPSDAETAPAAPQQTTVVVTGLVSVASIAGFKRQLARLGGVQTVAVSSGPEGEFVFTVTHDDRAKLHDAIPELSGFGARITGTADGVVEVTARDPDPES